MLSSSKRCGVPYSSLHGICHINSSVIHAATDVNTGQVTCTSSYSLFFLLCDLRPQPLPRLTCLRCCLQCMHVGRETFGQRSRGAFKEDGSSWEMGVEGNAGGVQGLARRAVGRGKRITPYFSCTNPALSLLIQNSWVGGRPVLLLSSC